MFRRLVAMVAISIITSSTYAATVTSAKLDKSMQNILIDITYSGGCGEHKFSLKGRGCIESSPVQCTVELVDFTNDYCKGRFYKTISISLKEAGVTDSYYSGGSLTILGDLDWRTNEHSNVDVTLP